MTNNDFKKLLNEALAPLQEGQAELRKALAPLQEGQAELRKALAPLQEGQAELRKALAPLQTSLDGVRKDLDTVKRDLQEVKDTQEEQILPSVTYVETTVKSYADRYVTNEDHIGRLDKRLNTVEENLGIQPPEELTIPQLN